jgi:fluoride exporter
MKEVLLVGIGGFSGSILRYLIYLVFAARNYNTFPYATLVINTVGCLLIGLASVLVERALPQSRTIYLCLSVGLLGGFTTFSAFGLETLNLLENQQNSLALFNILANVILGICAVWIGRFLLS